MWTNRRILESRAVLNWYSSQFKNNHFTEMCCGTEAGSHLRLIDSCITQRKAQGPSRVKKSPIRPGAAQREDGPWHQHLRRRGVPTRHRGGYGRGAPRCSLSLSLSPSVTLSLARRLTPPNSNPRAPNPKGGALHGCAEAGVDSNGTPAEGGIKAVAISCFAMSLVQVDPAESSLLTTYWSESTLSS